MSKFEQKMENIFDVAPAETIENPPEIIRESIPHESLELDLKADYETARENFHILIEKGKEAIDDILEIAKESEKGRDFEVAATLLKNVVEANEKMIDLHKKIREITQYKQQSAEQKTTINNALFVGSTAELSKLVKELNTKDVINGELK
jgi:hypothetical protein